ncbi:MULTISPECIES: hypothetical protein [unclassified Rathayibacter]|uniref:hypothetical protein n=1 Tax=unclassified Rathayibacter TaxID=2609250 RepID=UPI0006FE4223|nr:MULTISPECIES: hypothetical protein [unclassified Rathayibacter]KQQ00866.1 hypothetical protein ASF42_16280 [Rathayibacter sp. Leaf294]KQS10270.1 hypothetical protein ASG06_16280 [Rathayibacter sp. Leaf185]
MGAGSDTIENERRETATGWPAPAAADVSEGSRSSVAPRRPWWRHRAALIIAAVVAGLLLLAGGFGVGYGVGNAVGSSVGGFDPRGQMPDGGFGQGGGPGSQFEAPDGTGSGAGGTSGSATS